MHSGQPQESSQCNALLTHGIYDYLTQVVDVQNSAYTKTDFCSLYYEYNKDFLAGSVKASYFFAKGRVSFTSSQVQAMGSQMCSDSVSQTSSSTYISTISSVINPSAIEAYKECLRFSSAGLKINTVYRESDAANVIIDISYSNPIGINGNVTVFAVVMSPPGVFNCSGPLFNTPVSIGNNVVAMSCDRYIFPTPFNLTNRLIWASAATLTIMTNAGTITRSMSPIYYKPPIDEYREEINSLKQEISALRSSLNSTNQSLSALETKVPVISSFASVFFDGLLPNITYSKNIANVTKLSTGSFRFYFTNPPPSNNYVLLVSLGHLSFMPTAHVIEKTGFYFTIMTRRWNTGTTEIVADVPNVNILVMLQ